jgi:hypothetical protein
LCVAMEAATIYVEAVSSSLWVQFICGACMVRPYQWMFLNMEFLYWTESKEMFRIARCTVMLALLHTWQINETMYHPFGENCWCAQFFQQLWYKYNAKNLW